MPPYQKPWPSVSTSSAPYHRNVTKSDSVPLPAGVKGVYVGTSGDVVLACLPIGDAPAVDATYKNVPSGTTIATQATLIKVASTADDFVVLFGN